MITQTDQNPPGAFAVVVSVLAVVALASIIPLLVWSNEKQKENEQERVSTLAQYANTWMLELEAASANREGGKVSSYEKMAASEVLSIAMLIDEYRNAPEDKKEEVFSKMPVQSLLPEDQDPNRPKFSFTSVQRVHYDTWQDFRPVISAPEGMKKYEFSGALYSRSPFSSASSSVNFLCEHLRNRAKEMSPDEFREKYCSNPELALQLCYMEVWMLEHGDNLSVNALNDIHTRALYLREKYL